MMPAGAVFHAPQINKGNMKIITSNIVFNSCPCSAMMLFFRFTKLIGTQELTTAHFPKTTELHGASRIL